ncbi:hypothetical protein BBJ28_00010392 [Nothophytophthora sp. Chile5]|nr:hypothetical protein BBJ28_00010392 [Nothophytophthora sp. Chile5]
MGLELKKQKRRVLLHSMAALARRTKSTSSGGGCVPVLSAGPSPSPSLPPGFALSDESELRKEAPGGDCVLPVALQPRMAPLCMPSSLTARLPLALGLADASVVEDEAAVVPECADEAEEDQVEDEGAWSEPSEVDTLFRRASNVSTTAGDITSDESIMFAVALLRRLQQHANESELGEASVRREEVDQILQGFSRALEAVSTTWDERSVEDTVQKLFVTHSNVFDESMQNFFVQNFLHESESAKTFRTALRRTSMLRRCLLAMYQSEHSGTGGRRSSSIGGDKGIASRRWSTAVTQILKQKEEERRRHSIEVCPEVTNPSVVLAVKNEIANIDTSDFDVFAGHTSYSNNFHITVNDDLAVQYVYRSPLEHMHCALAFQLLKDPQCNILQGLTKIEQLEVRGNPGRFNATQKVSEDSTN